MSEDSRKARVNVVLERSLELSCALNNAMPECRQRALALTKLDELRHWVSDWVERGS